MVSYLLMALGWWGMTLIKFVLTPFFMIFNPGGDEHWSWLETIAIVSSGAAMWAFVFFHFGEYIFSWIAKHFQKNKKVFGRRSRWFIKIKQKWGLKGLLVISGLLSVPIASVLCAKLYHHNNTALPKLIIAFFVWTVFLTSLAWGMNQIGLKLV